MTKLRKLWKATWQIGLCLLLLAWVFHKIFLNEGQLACDRQGYDWDSLPRAEQWRVAWTIGPPELMHAMRLIKPSNLGVALGMTWIMIMLGVMRWRMVLRVQGLNLPLNRATRISFVAQFFSSFLLGSVGGDLIKAYYAARETHHKKTEAVVTVFVDRLIGLWAMLLFAGLMMLPNFQLLVRLRQQSVEMTGALLIILGMLAASSIVLFLAFWGGVSRRFPRARAWLRRMPKGELLERSLDSCRHFGRPKAFLFKCLILSLAVNTVVVLQVIVLASGLGLQIPPLALFVIVPTVVCISALPTTPGGLGVRENLYVIMLAGVGVSGTSALCLSLLAYATSLFWSLIGGIVYLGLKDRERLEEVTHDQPGENVGSVR